MLRERLPTELIILRLKTDGANFGLKQLLPDLRYANTPNPGSNRGLVCQVHIEWVGTRLHFNRSFG